MNKNTKRLLSTFAAFVLLLSLIIVPASAAGTIVASGSCGTNITWTLTDGGHLTLTGSGAMDDYRMDVEIPWYNVGNYNYLLTSVSVGSGITHIGDKAFYEQYDLTEIDLPDGLLNIGDWAFSNSNLGSVRIPNSVTTIGANAFSDCHSLSTALPSSLTSLGAGAFLQTPGYFYGSIRTNPWPSGVTRIESETFVGAGVSPDAEMLANITYIGSQAFAYGGYTGMQELPNISAVIEPDAFYNCYWKVATEHYKENADGTYALAETTYSQECGYADVQTNNYPHHKAVSHPDEVTSAIIPDIIPFGGAVTLKSYYSIDSHTLTYQSNGGSPVQAETVKCGSIISEPAAPTREGYTFEGWYGNSNFTYLYNFSKPVDYTQIVYAKWTPRSDTAYQVEHYQQDVTGAGYTLKDTDSLTGTTDANVAASPKVYVGFTENTIHASRAPSGNVAGNGSLELALYYDRDTFDVDFNTQGGSSVATQPDIRFGDITTEPAAPTKAGYDFGGWYTDEGCTTGYDFTAPVTANITVFAKWTAQYVPSDDPVTYYHITVTAGDSGSVSPQGKVQISHGSSKTFIITPVAGYELAGILLDGKSVLSDVQAGAKDGTLTYRIPSATKNCSLEVTFRPSWNPFEDVAEGDWFYDAVRDAYQSGHMVGVSETLFAPYAEAELVEQSPVTRQDVALFLYRSTVSDGQADHEQAMAWAVSQGLVVGNEHGDLMPLRITTRAELATVLARFLSLE